MADQAQSGWGPREKLAVLDKRIPRVDGPDKVTGRALYTHDIRLPGMLWGRILPSPHARASVQHIDTSAADRMPGVFAIIALHGKDLYYQGDPVAAVAAQSLEIAEDAIRAISVIYDVLPHVVDAATAMDPDAPQAHPGSTNIQPDDVQSDTPDDVEAHFAQCAAVVDAVFHTPFQHHSCLETHGVVVDYRGGDTATIYASTQGSFSVVGDAARELGLSINQVTGIVHHMGGGFGSKMGLDLPGLFACQLARKAGRPVHLMLTREDEFLMGGNRSASLQRLKLGAAKDGTFVAMTAEQHRMGGLGLGTQGPQPFYYSVQKCYGTMDSVITNIDSSRAFRAPGCPQASFAMESIIDDLAAALNIDTIGLRIKNQGDPVYQRQAMLAAKEIGWATGRNKQPGAGQTGAKKRGMGMGISRWGGGGGGPCQVTVKIGADGAVEVDSGTQDLGTGTRTVVAAVAAESLGLPVAAINAQIGDTRLGAAGASGGSATAASIAPAVKNAADTARNGLFARIAPNLGAQPHELSARAGMVWLPSGKSVPWKEACALLGSTPISAQGEWQEGFSDSGVHGVQMAEVEVDTETGKVRVLRLVAVQDCGLPINRLAVESQINGGMIQGLGYCLYEGKVTDRETGLMLNTNFEDYRLPGALEMPEFVTIIDDADTRGVIGVGEPPAIPTAGAIANAIYNACGVRVRSLPITPDKVLAGLAQLSSGGSAS